MKKNMGTIDVALRLVVALLFVILYFAGIVPGVAGIVLLVLAVVFTATSVIRFCPLYLPFGISTRKKE